MIVTLKYTVVVYNVFNLKMHSLPDVNYILAKLM